jgi:hypothetical protein
MGKFGIKASEEELEDFEIDFVWIELMRRVYILLRFYEP